jgi:ornithine--oxo-acid transaminase
MPNTTAFDDAVAHSARNYDPLPVVLHHGEGSWVTDVDGNRYLDLLASYGALAFGHRHPRILRAAREQLDRLTLTSRAFQHDRFGAFCRMLAELCESDLVLPMNSGAEAVETGLKLARKWGYTVKGVPRDRAVVVAFEGNFHGRTITLASLSTDPAAHDDYGPYTPGFRTVRYGDADALRAAVTDDVVAVLVEPIQGEAGVLIPPDGYLAAVRRICSEQGVLMVADEIQSGLGRTGRTFACDHEQVRPDVYLLGKALGGGVLPVSAVVGPADVLGVFRPGQHGSTFGGNPLACAVGVEVLTMLRTGEYQQRAAELGRRLAGWLAELPSTQVREVRCRGLWAGVEMTVRAGRDVCEGLLGRGVLAKETHFRTLRLSPPLVIEEPDLAWGIEQLSAELDKSA